MRRKNKEMSKEMSKNRSIAIEMAEVLKKYNVTYKDTREILGMVSRIIDRTTINPCDTDDTNGTDKDNTIGYDEHIAQKVKSEVLNEIMQEIPKAFEKTMYTSLKNVK